LTFQPLDVAGVLLVDDTSFFYCKWHIVYFLNYFFWKVEMSRARKPNLVDPDASSIIHFGLGKLSPPKLKHVVFFCKGFYGFFKKKILNF